MYYPLGLNACACMCFYMMQSTTIIILKLCTNSGRSFKRVKIGHITAPCGTPLITFLMSDNALSRLRVEF